MLGVVAPLFFFPLMVRYDDPENAFRVLGAQRGLRRFLFKGGVVFQA